ncbi:MAG: serine/threonine protein kinase [Planctomycetes bacterium]|nr:serine/threonine protein kinase [Planctomycetota bacterium]
MNPQTLTDPDLYLGLLAIRNEFVNLSELKHCVEVRQKLFKKTNQALDLGEVLVQQRYLTPQDLEYLHMLREAETGETQVDMAQIEGEFDQHVSELKPGAAFGDYKIHSELGRGGMGIVFRAITEDDEFCALKILIGGKNATVRDIERFKKEATVMAPLIHEGIVKILEVGRHKGLDFIAMEYVEGVSMKELVVGSDALAGDVSLTAIFSAADAVGFMHSHGIIHRDIKPENIMVRPDGRAVLMDFGLAGWDKIEILAGRGSIGTPMYQPPEQADVNGPFGKISPASDVYGLGATLYYLLTSRHPFLGRSVKEVREKIKTKPPDPIRQINPKVHAAVEALCLRCLRKRQSERFQTPKELNAHIKKVLKLLSGDGEVRKKDNPKVKLTRRVAAAIRRRGGKTNSDQGKIKGLKGTRPGSGRKTGQRKSGQGKAGAGRKTSQVGAARKSGGGPTGRQRGVAARPKADNTNMILMAVAGVGVLVALIIGFMFLFAD